MPLTQPAGTDAPDRSEEWVQESRNRPEWKRLQAALNLAQGFEFLAVTTEDVAAEDLLGKLLEQHATEKGVTLRGFDLSNPPAGKHVVTAILEEVEQAPRPCWFWFRGGRRPKAEEAELGHLFLLLNQKRDVISRRADAPFIIVLHPFDWKVFRRNAPDFWSIHHAVFRFGPGARPESARRDVPLDLNLGQLAARPSRGPRWRMELGSTAESSSNEFVGRTSEIRQLTAALVERGARLLVTGPGGIGKTSLVRAVLPLVASRYSEGVWWVPFGDLPGDYKDRTAAALTGILADLLPFVSAPPDLEGLAQLFRSATDGSPRLFVFDEVDDAKAIEWLIPGKSASVVVTSRSSRPSHVRIEQLQLGALSEADSVALLRRIAPRIGDQAAEVARLCGHLPLALRLAAGALASRPGLSPTQLIRGLGGGGKRPHSKDESLAAIINYSLTALPVVLQKRYRQLGTFAGSFASPAAAAVWGLNNEAPEEIGSDLGSLVRCGLLEERNGRFELHPLLCSAVWSPLANDERLLAGLRHAAHYCEVLRQASHLYQEDNRAGLALFDLEAHQIRAGQARTAKYLDEQEEAARLASEYPIAGGQILQLRLSPGELVKWLEAGLVGARRVHGPGLEGYFLRNLGLALAAAGEVQAAIEKYEQARRISIEEGDRYVEADAIRALGNAYETLGETHRAIEHYEEYLAIAREVGDQHNEAKALGLLALAYSAMGDEKRAIELYEQYLAIARAAGDRRSEAITLGSLANSFAHLGETQRAIELSQGALAIFRETGDLHGEAQALNFLAAINALSGNAEVAIKFAELALERSRTLGDLQGEAIALRVLGRAFRTLGETRRAIELSQNALSICERIGDKFSTAGTLLELSGLFIQVSRVEEAIAGLQRAARLFDELQDPIQAASTWHDLADLLEAVGRSEAAAEIRARLE